MLSIKEIKNNQRNCFINFMKRNGLKSRTWAKKSGIAEATIRHYLNGRTSTMTVANLELLAQCVQVTISNLIDSDSISSPR